MGDNNDGKRARDSGGATGMTPDRNRQAHEGMCDDDNGEETKPIDQKMIAITPKVSFGLGGDIAAAIAAARMTLEAVQASRNKALMSNQEDTDEEGGEEDEGADDEADAKTHSSKKTRSSNFSRASIVKTVSSNYRKQAAKKTSFQSQFFKQCSGESSRNNPTNPCR
jgi:hypothetical protein